MCTTNETTSSTSVANIWRPDDGQQPVPKKPGSTELFRPDVLETIEKKIQELDKELHVLSLDIHAHPELGYQEFHAHDTYTAFMEKHEWDVTRKFHLDTAWQAVFTHGSGGRTIGVNSEMDALKGVGHACGHNLIGIAGVAIAMGLRAAMEKHDIPGKIELLGTPAEEGGNGKGRLLDAGAYKGMDICVMCHPAPGPVGSVSLSGSLAVEALVAEYKGKNAHAALSPWEGKNALDAAVLAYNNIAALRQQLKPTHRIHGIFEGTNWVVNIIPENAKFLCLIRAPTIKEVKEDVERVRACLEAAGLATGCEAKVESLTNMFEIRQNTALGGEVANIVLNKYGAIDYEYGISSASTDFGVVSYALPSLHPGFAIPTVIDGGNHTPQFAQASTTQEAHYATLDVSKALAGTAARVLLDDTFFDHVKKSFESDRLVRG
ncbi:hypothetical protein CPB83DRAFT_886687 [Crepidotus variabilis]|uniref:Peptidase M20 domain-containing protein 2 n=1 Tax=Crepidotus variabilis TaxID=179855 RepID=A0A9P6JK02_9AGAR|nr:hypothetical protein CPB83DRAFT_886687 [Crepidotus variabilis]